MKTKLLLMLFFMLLIIFSACRKENSISNIKGQTQWMRVLTDTITSSTDDEMHLGENGKVLTNSNDEIYLYYYLKNLSQTVVLKCDSKGNPIWKKVIENLSPGDMVLLNNGSVIISGTDPNKIYKWNKIYAIRPEGNIDSLYFEPAFHFENLASINSSLYALPDNNIIFSGTTSLFNAPPRIIGTLAKINAGLAIVWKRNLSTNSALTQPIQSSQNSIIAIANNKYLFQFAQTFANNYVDSNYFGLQTGVLNTNGTIATLNNYPTGYFVTTTNNTSGVQNRYCNELMQDATGDVIYHYSSPKVFGTTPAIPAAFIKMDSNAKVKDTIPIPLPVGYRIVSCTQNKSSFFLTAYKTGGVTGATDFSAGYTLILTGINWQTSNSFTLQNFYSDFFSSAAPTMDGGYVIMGKIQSFNGTSNKLVLIKWKQ